MPWYRTAFGAFWSHLRKANIPPLLLLLAIITTAALADLVGVLIIASASVTEISQSYSSLSYFIGDSQGRNNWGSIHPIFSSTEFYPHILLQGEQIAFLPIRFEESVPFSYSGPALGGNFSHKCVPADLTGTIIIGAWTPYILINGTVTAQVMGGLRSEQVNCNVSTSDTNIQSRGDPLVVACLFFNPLFHWDGLWSFLALQVSELFYVYAETHTVAASGQSNGTLDGVGDESQINWALHVCEIALPYLVGDVVASSISPAETLLYSDSGNLYPKMPIHETVMTFSAWDQNMEFERLGFTHEQPDDASRKVALDFSEFGGVLFSRAYISGPTAADVLISGLVGSSDAKNLSKALSTALLYSMASFYRRQIPYFSAGYPCQYSLPLPATAVMRPAFLYAACTYTFCLAIVALILRWVVLHKLGINRTGFVLATCAVIQASPLQALISDGDKKSREELLGDIDKIRGPITLGTAVGGGQAQVEDTHGKFL